MTFINYYVSRFIVLAYISIFVCSCSKDLSRDKAAELIIKKSSLPQNETISMRKIYIKSSSGMGCFVTGTQYSEVQTWLNGLEQKGLIKVTEKGPIGDCNIYQAVVKLTENGKQYLVGEDNENIIVKTSEICFGEITGIQLHEQFKVAEANYTLIRKNITPFGIDISSQPEKRIQSFSLYDDGWRIGN